VPRDCKIISSDELIETVELTLNRNPNLLIADSCYSSHAGCDYASFNNILLPIRKEGWKGKIIWMSPDKFLHLAHPLQRPSSYSLDNIEKRIKEQLPIDHLVLWIDPQRRKVISHEGRHRATIAKKLGVEKVPVLIIVHIWDKRVPQWTKAQHDFVDKADFKPEWDNT
jgi:hypothetical protein